jgi:putative MATE family efflux protein
MGEVDPPDRRQLRGNVGPPTTDPTEAGNSTHLANGANGSHGSAAAAEDGGRSRPPDGAVATASPGRQGPRRGASAERDLTNGSVPKNLASLAWPQFVEGVLNVFDQVWDLFLAGQGFGFRAIAGIGSAQQVVQLARTGRMGIDTAMRAMIARAIGAGDIELAKHIAMQAFAVNLSFALFITTVGVIFTEVMLQALGISDAVIDQAAGYMRWQFIGTVALTSRMMTGAALQAAGDTVTPMKATMVARLIDLALSPVLMFGLLGMPEFGVAGVAVSNCIGQAIGASINIYNLSSGRARLTLSWRDYHFDPRVTMRLIRLATPATINSVERSTAQVVLLAMMAPFGDVALAAYALTQRTQMIVNLGTQGLGNASGIIAGQNLGAGKIGRARETVVWALGYVTVVKLVLVSVLFTFPTTFLSIFSSDPELMDVGTTWLRIMLVGYFAMGPVQVLMQSFQTAGDTFMPMMTTLAAMWLIEMPLALILSGAGAYLQPFGVSLDVLPTVGDLGQYGVAVAISAAAFFRLAVYLPYFVWGPWTRKHILEGVSAQPVR